MEDAQTSRRPESWDSQRIGTRIRIRKVYGLKRRTKPVIKKHGRTGLGK